MGGYPCVYRLMPSWDCINVLSVYYAMQMVNENVTTAFSSRFLIKGTTVHGVCPVFVVFSSLGANCRICGFILQLQPNTVLHNYEELASRAGEIPLPVKSLQPKHKDCIQTFGIGSKARLRKGQVSPSTVKAETGRSQEAGWLAGLANQRAPVQ